jgi:arabinogalactan endo-1,4-beta-galactosidase
MNCFKWIILFLGVLIFSGCGDNGEPEPEPQVSYPIAIRAADISFLPEIREAGIVFKNLNGQAGDALTILQQAGCNTIRLRIWHTPATQHSGLQEVKEFAAEIKSKGLKLWLTVHYSDTWADPGTQTKPAAWNTLSTEVLGDSVYLYTKKIVTQLSPDYIQIGNEINGGFLWPDGSVSNVANFTTLLKKGIQGARDASSSTKIMIHYGGVEGTTWFYDLLKNNSVTYDIIALSYYPRWHTKSLLSVKSILAQLATNYSKEIILAETGYPFTLGWNDWTNNLVGLTDHLVVGYPATPKGQHDFMMQVRKIVSETNGGLGLAYWAPEWVAYRGEQAENGSPWENMALFDFEFKALEAIQVFKE